jgi:hypothetical protein
MNKMEKFFADHPFPWKWDSCRCQIVAANGVCCGDYGGSIDPFLNYLNAQVCEKPFPGPGWYWLMDIYNRKFVGHLSDQDTWKTWNFDGRKVLSDRLEEPK